MERFFNIILVADLLIFLFSMYDEKGRPFKASYFCVKMAMHFQHQTEKAALYHARG